MNFINRVMLYFTEVVHRAHSDTLSRTIPSLDSSRSSSTIAIGQRRSRAPVFSSNQSPQYYGNLSLIYQCRTQ